MTPHEFPRIFAEGWALPNPTEFLSYFLPLIDPHATFAQPGFPDAHGHPEIERMFRQLFGLIPDLKAIPQRSAVNDGTVFIESQCAGTLGHKPIRFAVCDRFEIRGGLITERQSYSDPLPILAGVLRHPSTWSRLVKTRR